MTVSLIPLTGMPEVGGGDDLAALLARAIAEAGGLREGDVVVVTQKVVSKAEGRVVDEEQDGKAAWVARETARVVARRGDLVIAETRHGFVCANAGVDASNVGEGKLSLLPVDPDRSASALRSGLARAFGVAPGIVVTDTFGRPWRNGLLNVAIGCAGVPALVDLRGTPDANGRILDVTVLALADEVAAASGLVIGKADRVPAAIVRGLTASGVPQPARALVRPAAEDLFREGPLTAVAATGQEERSEAGLGADPGTDLRAALAAAIDAARASLGPDGSRVSLAVSDEEATPAPSILVACRDEHPDGPLVAGAGAQALRIALHALGVTSSLEPFAGQRGDGWRPVARVRLRRPAPPS